MLFKVQKKILWVNSFKRSMITHISNSQFIQKGSIEYNSKDFTEGITRQEAKYFNTKIQKKTLQSIILVSYNYLCANVVRNTNIYDIKEVQK